MDIKVFQLHKRASYEFKYIQDKFAISPDTKTFALADGTTQSFYSEIWAEIITKGFVENPKFNTNELISCFTDQVLEYKNANFEFSSNPAKASLERTKKIKGGTSTFIGLQFRTENRIELVSCGDSNCFLLDSENKVDGFPFSDVDTLDANNKFINTEQLIENKVDATFFHVNSIECKSNDTIIIATDAISRLIFTKPTSISEILKINDFYQLHDFCLKYWESKELQDDDISIIIIPIKNSGIVKIIQPTAGFFFPKEKEEEFVPTSLPQERQKIYTPMESNDIRNQFKAVEHDFHQVKKKLKLNELLLMIIISLLVVNIIFSNLFTTKNSKGENIETEVNSEKIIIKEYEDTISDLESEIQKLKIKIADFSTSEVERVETIKESSTVSKAEAKKRQEELIKAGYKVTADGVWGEKSEKTWNEYQKKKKDKK